MTGPVGATARPLARWLGLAAAPTFAIMAVLTAMSGGPADAMCGAGSWLSGMAPMYLDERVSCRCVAQADRGR